MSLFENSLVSLVEGNLFLAPGIEAPLLYGYSQREVKPDYGVAPMLVLPPMYNGYTSFGYRNSNQEPVYDNYADEDETAEPKQEPTSTKENESVARQENLKMLQRRFRKLGWQNPGATGWHPAIISTPPARQARYVFGNDADEIPEVDASNAPHRIAPQNKRQAVINATESPNAFGQPTSAKNQ